MKKKLFTLLTLLLCVCSGAWAEDVIFSWEGNADEPIVTGGSVSVLGSDDGVNVASPATYDGESHYVIKVASKKANVATSHTEISLGTSLKEGDKIKVSGYQNKNATDKVVTLYMQFLNGETKKGDISDNDNWVNLYNSADYANATAPETKTFNVTSTLEGSNKIFITRNTSGTNLWISKIEIIRETPRTPTSLTFASTSSTINLGDAFELPILTKDPTTLEVSYSSSNTSVADINSSTGAVTVKGGGVTTFTASFAGDETYAPSSATYTLTVIAPLNAVTSKTWDFSNKTQWPKQTLTSDYQSDNLIIAANSEKTVVIAASRIELGGAGNSSARHIKFKVAGRCRISLTFVSSSSTTRTLNVDYGSFGTNLGSVSNSNSSTTKSVDYTSDEETTIYVYSTNGAIHVSKIVVTPLVEVTVPSTGFATYVNSEYALDYSGKSITPYIIKAQDENTVSLEAKVKVAKGEPVLLSASGSATQYILTGASASASDGNLLVAGDGSSVSYTESNHYYILSTVSGVTGFYRAKNNPVAVGKAYLNAGAAAAHFFSLDINGETTGITSVIPMVETKVGVFDLQGRRVTQPQKGLYIVNGKKVVVK